MSAGDFQLAAGDQLVDANGPYEPGEYIDGRDVHIYGQRGLFTYLAFVDDLSWVTKVPSAWVSA